MAFLVFRLSLAGFPQKSLALRELQLRFPASTTPIEHELRNWPQWSSPALTHTGHVSNHYQRLGVSEHGSPLAVRGI